NFSWQLGRVCPKRSQSVFYLFNVYGLNSIIGKREVWQDISRSLLPLEEHLLLGGDFNAITSEKDKKGGLKRNRQSQ
ncbi:hypothetical protein KI387_019358, partial [Taxus chinensis]